MTDGHNAHYLNRVCWGTNFQVVEEVHDNVKEAKNVYRTFAKACLRIYGPPSVLVVDAGLEFRGIFSRRFGLQGTAMHRIDTIPMAERQDGTSWRTPEGAAGDGPRRS